MMLKQFGLKFIPLNLKDRLPWGVFIDHHHLNNADDINIEVNIERIHLLNKEIIIVSDINIDYRSKSNYEKHMLVKGLKSMHFKQLVDFITCPVSKTCLDHLYCNQPQKVKLVISHNIGLSDHLPVSQERNPLKRVSNYIL
jgi:endonuclease/exonuclease/phosphatase family metal-dependent hydrolase